MKQFDKKMREKVFSPRNYAKKNLKGFTILEMIVAISLITVGIFGVFALITQTISNSAFSRDEMTAAYLAQEGIEIVRNIRDSNWIKGQAWDDNLNEDARGYYSSYSSPGLSVCDTNCPDLKIDQDGFYYSP